MIQILRRNTEGVYAKWLIAVGLLIIVLPVLYGLFIKDSYALVDPMDHFTLMLSNLLPLTFPLLVTLLGAQCFAEVLADRYLFYTATRTSLRKYLASHGAVLMATAFAVFFLAVLLAWVVAFLVEPALGNTTYYGAEGTGTVAEPTQRHTFTQLVSLSPLVYGMVYAVWVGACAAVFALLGMLLLLVIPHRFVALSLPFVGYQVVSFVLAVLGLEAFVPSSVVFPFNIIQQPLWTPFVPLVALIALCAILVAKVHARPEEIQGLA